MYATGLNDETPFTFANAIPGLKFYWSSTNPDVCQVKSVYALVSLYLHIIKQFYNTYDPLLFKGKGRFRRYDFSLRL